MTVKKEYEKILNRVIEDLKFLLYQNALEVFDWDTNKIYNGEDEEVSISLNGPSMQISISKTGFKSNK